MIIYEVNLIVDPATGDEFEHWLRNHVQEMLGFEGFGSAEIFSQAPGDVVDGDPDKRYWTVQYRIRDRSSLDNYLTEHAQRMRNEGLMKFPGQFSASRRILIPTRQG